MQRPEPGRCLRISTCVQGPAARGRRGPATSGYVPGASPSAFAPAPFLRTGSPGAASNPPSSVDVTPGTPVDRGRCHPSAVGTPLVTTARRPPGGLGGRLTHPGLDSDHGYAIPPPRFRRAGGPGPASQRVRLGRSDSQQRAVRRPLRSSQARPKRPALRHNRPAHRRAPQRAPRPTPNGAASGTTSQPGSQGSRDRSSRMTRARTRSVPRSLSRMTTRR